MDDGDCTKDDPDRFVLGRDSKSNTSTVVHGFRIHNLSTRSWLMLFFFLVGCQWKHNGQGCLFLCMARSSHILENCF